MASDFEGQKSPVHVEETINDQQVNDLRAYLDVLDVLDQTDFVAKNHASNTVDQPEYSVSLTQANEADTIAKYLAKELAKFQLVTGRTQVDEHRIRMKDETPIKIRYQSRNEATQAIINSEIDNLLQKGYIEPSHSPYCSPITLVKKKNGKWRLCMDYRQLNKRSEPDAYPLPRINLILDRLRESRYISSIDLENGYWQVPMAEGSKKYTAFAVVGRRLYQWRVMPFGLHSAPATFQRVLDTVIGPELEPFAFAYLDDIIVIGKTLAQHMENLSKVFRRLRDVSPQINVSKCKFFRKQVKYLSHLVTDKGITTDLDKIEAIVRMRPPNSHG